MLNQPILSFRACPFDLQLGILEVLAIFTNHIQELFKAKIKVAVLMAVTPVKRKELSLIPENTLIDLCLQSFLRFADVIRDIELTHFPLSPG